MFIAVPRSRFVIGSLTRTKTRGGSYQEAGRENGRQPIATVVLYTGKPFGGTLALLIKFVS